MDELTVEIRITKGGVLLYRATNPAFLEMAADNMSIIEIEPSMAYGWQDPYIFRGFRFSPVTTKLKEPHALRLGDLILRYWRRLSQ